jgi:uncharacterized protein YjiS (DUF1127 family)
MPYAIIEKSRPVDLDDTHAPSIVTVTIAAIAWCFLQAVRMAIVMDIAMQRRRTRRFLGELTDHELRDIGLTRAQARHEASRRWWD